MPGTDSNLFKTVLFLTKTIFTFLIVSLLIYLNFIDLKENNNNRAYLNLLNNIYDKYSKSQLVFKDYELQRLDTLKFINASIYQKHFDSRVALVKALNTY